MSWKSSILRIGDKSSEYGASSDFKDHIETCFGALRQELEHSSEDILALPHKIPLYGTVVGSLNLENEDFAIKLVQNLQTDFQPKSAGANVMKQTIETCETTATAAEDKYCATSLESLIDHSVSRLGKSIQVPSTEVEKETQTGEFNIGKGVKNMGENNIVCYKMKYSYAVFLCHSIDKTDLYTVPLVGSDGTKVKAAVVCHKC